MSQTSVLSEARYDLRPTLLRARPFSVLVVDAIALLGILLVVGGRYHSPAELGELLPWLANLSGKTIQFVGVAIFALAVARIYVWFFVTNNNRLRITDDTLIWTHGFLTKYDTEIKLDAIRNVEIRQRPLQRMLDGCDLTVFAQGSAPAVVVRGLPYPARLRSLLSERRPGAAAA